MGLIRLYVSVLFCFMLLCYFDETIYYFFFLVPVHTLSGLIWKQDSSHLFNSLKDIGIHTVW